MGPDIERRSYGGERGRSGGGAHGPRMLERPAVRDRHSGHAGRPCAGPGRLHHLEIGAAFARRRVLDIVDEQEVTVRAVVYGDATATSACPMIDLGRSHRLAAPVRLLVLPAISGVLLLLVLALPDLGPPLSGSEVMTAYHGRIVTLLDPHRPDPTGEGGGFLPDAKVLLLEGPQTGQEVEAYLQGPGGQQDNTGYRVGEDVVVTFNETGDGSASFAAVQDRWRLPQLGVLALVFALAVVAAGGWRGLRALLALALTVAVVIRVLVPLLLQGVPPIPVAVILATAITILTVGLTEGFSRASVAAILGTAGALAITALLAAVTIAATGFSNAAGTDLVYLQIAPGVGLDLRGLLLAAFMLGAIGVLDDVTVTQAAAVEELVEHAGLRGRRLYASAFNVGRSHIAATVNTLFLAYLGASLPLVVLFAASRQPTNLILNGELVAIEIVRTLVGSLGIVAAVPFTTLIAVWLTARHGIEPETGSSTRGGGIERCLQRPAVALVAGLAAIGLLTAGVAAVMAPLIVSPPRSAVVPDQFGGTPPPSAGASPEPSRNPPATSVPAGDPPIIQVGATIPVVDGPAALGSVTVLQHRTEGAAAGGTRLFVEVRYVAQQVFEVRPDAWGVVPLEGEPTAGQPASVDPPLEAATLEAGESITGWLEFAVPAAGSTDLFLDYHDAAGSTLFIVALF